MAVLFVIPGALRELAGNRDEVRVRRRGPVVRCAGAVVARVPGPPRSRDDGARRGPPPRQYLRGRRKHALFRPPRHARPRRRGGILDSVCQWGLKGWRRRRGRAVV